MPIKYRFLMPNQRIAQDVDLKTFEVEPDVIYKAIGTRLFPKLPARDQPNVRPLCEVVDCTLPVPNWWILDKKDIDTKKSLPPPPSSSKINFKKANN